MKQMVQQKLLLLLCLIAIAAPAACFHGKANVTLLDNTVFVTEDQRAKQAVQYLQGQYDTWIAAREVVIAKITIYAAEGEHDKARKLAMAFNGLDKKVAVIHDSMVDILNTTFHLKDSIKRESLLMALLSERGNMQILYEDFQLIVTEFNLPLTL